MFVSCSGAGHRPRRCGLALLWEHYRADREWTAATLTAGERAARPLDRRGRAPRPARTAPPLLAEVRAALADDLDAPWALGAVDAWCAAPGEDDGAPRRSCADVVDGLLGVTLALTAFEASSPSRRRR